MIKFLDLGKQYQSIKKEVDDAIFDVINNSAFIGGEKLAKFESEFAAFQEAHYCVGVGNGTDAIEIALEALSLPSGGEVIVPANSFVASSEAVTRSGLKVVFADCRADNYTLCLDSVNKQLTPNTVAIVAVHLYGHPCDMDGIKDIASRHNLAVIEDCAQAHGAKYKGVSVGAIGDVGTFSFYPGKNLGAYGDGGAITTNNESLEEKCRMIANHGRVGKYDHEFEGRNSRLDSLQAAILSIKLTHLESWLVSREVIADQYLEGLKDIDDITLPERSIAVRQAYHLFVIRSQRRDELASFLKENNVQVGVHYPVALPKLKAYDYLGQDTSAFFACQSDSSLLSLPIGEHLSGEEIERVIQLVQNFHDS